jgi:hypothetical protein
VSASLQQERFIIQWNPHIPQGNFVLEPRKFWIAIEIEIVIEIDFWQLSDFDAISLSMGVALPWGVLMSTLQSTIMKSLKVYGEQKCPASL